MYAPGSAHMTRPRNDVPLPAGYRRALQRLAGTEIALDWRRIASREPAVWPGTLRLWTADEARTENEVNNYLKRVAAEIESQTMPDDESADRVRLEAPDIAAAAR